MNSSTLLILIHQLFAIFHVFKWLIYINVLLIWLRNHAQSVNAALISLLVGFSDMASRCGSNAIHPPVHGFRFNLQYYLHRVLGASQSVLGHAALYRLRPLLGYSDPQLYFSIHTTVNIKSLLFTANPYSSLLLFNWLLLLKMWNMIWDVFCLLVRFTIRMLVRMLKPSEVQKCLLERKQSELQKKNGLSVAWSRASAHLTVVRTNDI